MYVGMDMDAGVYVLRRGLSLCGYDVSSRSEKWSVKIKLAKIAPCAGRTLVAARKQDGTLAVLRMATGEEVWRYGNRNYGLPGYMDFIGDTDWLQVMFVKEYDERRVPLRFTCLLYTPDGDSCYRLPKDHSANVITSDGRTAFLSSVDVREAASDLVRISSLALDTGSVIPGFEFESEDCLGMAGTLDSDKTLVLEYRQKEEERTYSMVNAQTGALLSPLTLPERKLGGLRIFADKNKFVFGSDKRETLWVQDSATGEILHTRRRDGHRFLHLAHIRMDANGDLWALSGEQNNSLWLWQVNAETEPRLLVDAANYLSPGMGGSPFHYGHFLEYTWGASDAPLIARRLTDLTITTRWPLPGNGWDRPFPSEDMRRVLIGRSDQNRASMHAVVYESGLATPVFETEGNPLAFSPDGGHALIEREKHALLVPVDTGVIESDFSLEQHGSVLSTFSPDSRLLAVYVPPSIRVVRLEEAYPETELFFPNEEEARHMNWENGLCFSPDGKKLLAAGFGRAWLFNTDTGTCLKTLVERTRVTSTGPMWIRGRESDFLTTVRDFAGGFTDRFKDPPFLGGSFILDGSKCVTDAQGALLHVWDTTTGDSVRNIPTELPESRSEDGWIFNRVVFSPNGAFACAFNDEQGLASLIDVIAGRTIRQYKDDRTRNVYRVYVADDGEVYLYNAIGLCRL